MGRELKPVCFNLKTEFHLLEFAEQTGNFSGWVKDRIRERLNSNQVLPDEVHRAIRELLQQEIKKAGFSFQEEAGYRDQGLSDDISAFML